MILCRTDVKWCGLDFSKVRLIGSEGFTDPLQIKEYYFNTWNSLMMSESDKYNWRKALMTGNLKIDYGPVAGSNLTVNEKLMVINSSYSIDETQIQASAKALSTKDYTDGIGVFIVVESLDKGSELATGYLTFFDLGSKNVLFTRKVTGKPGGFGFRNYWASAFHKIMEATQGPVMREIRSKYR